MLQCLNGVDAPENPGYGFANINLYSHNTV